MGNDLINEFSLVDERDDYLSNELHSMYSKGYKRVDELVFAEDRVR